MIEVSFHQLAACGMSEDGRLGEGLGSVRQFNWTCPTVILWVWRRFWLPSSLDSLLSVRPWG
jgi:hypothetical protein